MTIPEKMAAVLLTGHGGLDKLVYDREVSVPTPAEGEVLIRVTACGMNNTDVWVRQAPTAPRTIRPRFPPGAGRAIR